MREKSTPAVAWLAELVRRSSILDAVEDLHGPALLCWTTYFFIKEAGDPAFVSWHRDSTYWGLSTPDVVTAWVAFTQATEANGAMEYIPRGHKLDQIPNCDTLYRVVWHPPRGASQGSPPLHESFPLWVKSGYLPASGVARPLIAISDDDGLAFRTYNRRLATQVSDEPRLAHRAGRDIVRRCFGDGPHLTGRRAHQD
jgi:hypothetical protein